MGSQDLDPICHEFLGVLDSLCEDLVAKGKLSSTFDELPFGSRYRKIIQETGEVFAQKFRFTLP